MKKLAVAVCAAVAAASGAFAGKIYYFDPVNGKDTNNGLTEETAFQNLSKKSGDSCGEGDEYRLMKGVYTNTFIIKKCNVTIRGWNASRDEVIIDGQGERRGIRMNTYDRSGYTNCQVIGLTVRNCRISTYSSNNGYNGAGIMMMSDDFLVSNCVVRSCVQAGVNPDNSDQFNTGGGMSLLYRGKVIDCEISGCSAPAGGGISTPFNQADASYEIRGCTITNNHATYKSKYGGGGIMAQFGVIISDCHIAGNSSANLGGGIYFTDYNGKVSTIDNEVRDSQIVSNTAKNGGGAYVGKGLTNRFFRVAFVGNCATNANTGSDAGGGLWANSDALNYLVVGSGCSFVGNRALGGPAGGLSAGGIGFQPMSNVLFRANSAYNIGGGARLSSIADALITDCIFDANSVSGVETGAAGGALVAGSGHGHVATICNCLFTDNVVSNGVGGAIGNAATRSITNYVFNCTFVNNGVCGSVAGNDQGTGGAIGAVSAHYCVSNSVFYGNWAVKQNNVQIGHGNGGRATVADVGLGHSYENKLVKGNMMQDGVNGCIVAEGDPGFTDAANGDYTLTKDSILVDKGVHQDWMDSATDLRQKKRCKRVYNNIVDIGCYEYWPVRGLLLIFR